MDPTIPAGSMSNSSFNPAGSQSAASFPNPKPGIPRMYVLAGVVLLVAIILAAVFVGMNPAQKPLGALNLGNTTAANPQPTANLSGLSLKQLQALNKAVECDIKTSDANVKLPKLYVKGDKVRMEAQVETNGKTSTSSTILSENTIYYDVAFFKQLLSANGPGITCDWLKFDATQAELCGMNSSTLEKQAPASSLTCRQASFGDEEFSPAGKVCDFADKTSMDVVVLMGFFPGCAAAPSAPSGSASAQFQKSLDSYLSNPLKTVYGQNSSTRINSGIVKANVSVKDSITSYSNGSDARVDTRLGLAEVRSYLLSGTSYLCTRVGGANWSCMQINTTMEGIPGKDLGDDLAQQPAIGSLPPRTIVGIKTDCYSLKIPPALSSEYCYAADGALLYASRFSSKGGNTTNSTMEALAAPVPALSSDFVPPAAPSSVYTPGQVQVVESPDSAYSCTQVTPNNWSCGPKNATK